MSFVHEDVPLDPCVHRPLILVQIDTVESGDIVQLDLCLSLLPYSAAPRGVQL
jgi:hypothetical protein